MTSSIAIVDSGTTTTRVRLTRRGRVVAAWQEAVGGRDTAKDGHNNRLKATVRRLLETCMRAASDVKAAVFSGMITSNVGLLEIPHLEGPVGLEELARGVIRHDLLDICDLPCYFVPGVRFGRPEDDLASVDMMRGEEVELFGLRELLGLEGPTTFFHFGSHHKAIDMDRAGRIVGSRTALTGELLSAISEHTILKSSLNVSELGTPVPEAWRQGLLDSQQYGVGRALFLVRVGEQVRGLTKEHVTSYFMGVLASLDLLLLGPEPYPNLVMYGRGNLKQILNDLLRSREETHVFSVDDRTSEEAAAVGAWLVFSKRLELRAYS